MEFCLWKKDWQMARGAFQLEWGFDCFNESVFSGGEYNGNFPDRQRLNIQWKGVVVVVVVQSLSHVWLFATQWTAARQASLSFTVSLSLLKLLSIELVMPSNHVNLCHPLLLLPSIFSSITVFSNESALRVRWPKYWSFSFGISPSNEYSGLISFRKSLSLFPHLFAMKK